MKKIQKNKGATGIGAEIILLIIIVFIIWILTGGAKRERPESPLLVPNPVPISPIGES